MFDIKNLAENQWGGFVYIALSGKLYSIIIEYLMGSIKKNKTARISGQSPECSDCPLILIE